MKDITPKEYEELKGMDRLGWTPEYIGHKTKKVRDYSTCDDCGHQEFLGWVERSFPVGKPIAYKYHKPDMMEKLSYEWAQHSLEMMKRYHKVVKQPEMDGETVKINFTRHTPLESNENPSNS